MKAAESALMSVVRLESYKYDQKARLTSRLAMGTGFFYINGRKDVFLITNRHLVFDKKIHYFPDKLRLHVHTDPNSFAKIKEIELNLWDKNGNRLWRHSRSYPVADVIAIEMPSEKLENCIYNTFSKKDIIDNPNSLPGRDINLGIQALVLGYPLDFYDRLNHFPITRSAGVATWPWFGFDRKPCFLIDARLHHGMSGSPVLSSPGSIQKNPKSTKKYNKTEQEVFLLGVFSAEWEVDKEPLGLNIVWHASIIEDIVS